jgi:Fe-S cluster assembly protein SufD
MTAVQEKQDIYFERFAALAEAREGREPSWLRDIRRAAIDRFGDLGFPTTRHEEWRFTNVAPIARTAFRPAAPLLGPSEEPLDSRLRNFSLSSVLPWSRECHSLVFVNGRFAPGLSSLASLPAGVKAGSLAAELGAASSTEGAALEAHLARHAGYQHHAFVALNTALFEDGALVEVPPNTVVEKPMALVFVTLPESEPHMTHPRNLILAGAGSQASFIEIHLHFDEAGHVTGHVERSPRALYFTNSVTEVVAGGNAILDYTRLQKEGDQAFHVGILQVEQERSSSVTTHAVALGGLLDREEVRAVLAGEGAEALLHGLYVINGWQHVDNHTVIDHAKPHCSSREVYKGVLDGHAGGVFNGKIIVRKDAQKTDSKQSNKNLLLSEDASINTKPQLEIYADDVKCTHGATIGQIDPEAVFYLRSRGIGLEEARGLLIQAFANDILDRIKFEPLRLHLREALHARLARTRSEAREGSGAGQMSALEEVD